MRVRAPFDFAQGGSAPQDLPRVLVETPAPPASPERSIGKETLPDFLVCVFPFQHAKASFRLWKPGAKNWFLPTNSAARLPICVSRSPIVATISACIAVPATKARFMANCRLPITCAWRGCWSRWGSLKLDLPAASRCSGVGLLTSFASWQNCDLRG